MRPRIRTVKPELHKHETLFDLERSTGLPMRIAWVGLFTMADREGRFQWRPRALKAEILPYDEGLDFARVLEAWAAAKMILRYEVDGEAYGWIPTFFRHQVINNREGASELPGHPNEREILASLTREARVDHAGKVEGKGREGNRTEGGGAEFSPPPQDAPRQKRTAEIGEAPLIAAVLEDVSHDLQTLWRDKYDAAWMKESLARAIAYHLKKEGVDTVQAISNWQRRLDSWFAQERKPKYKTKPPAARDKSPPLSIEIPENQPADFELALKNAERFDLKLAGKNLGGRSA